MSYQLTQGLNTLVISLLSVVNPSRCCIGENRGPRVEGQVNMEFTSLSLLFMYYIPCYNPVERITVSRV
jgi:hypothetical protein